VTAAASGPAIKGGTATVALPPNTVYSWIFPFYSIANASVYNDNQFQWLFYRPLYMFGGNNNSQVTVNYPLSTASQPVYSNGGKTVVVNLKGWKFSDGESVDAQSVVFFMNMTEAEKDNWYAYAKGLLPDNVVSYKATGPDQVTFQLNQAYSSLWYTALPATNPLSGSYYLEPFLSYGIQYAQPNFNNPQVGYMVRQLYIRQAMQYAMNQPGISKALWRGYSNPGSGPVPTVPSNQFIPSIERENNGQGPYPYNPSKAKALLTSHGWSPVGGVMTCQDPSKCGTGITQGEQLKFTFVYATGIAAATATWQAIKSEESSVGIDVTIQGESFNTIIGQSLPCAPMGPKCNVQVFAYGGWNYDGPGFEPTGEPLFETGAGSNSGNYSDPTMDKLIQETHTSNSPGVFDQFATYASQQLPFMWIPEPEPYQIQAVTSKLHGVTFNPDFTLLPEYWYYTK